MQIKEPGEFGLIDHIRKKFDGYHNDSVTGIGDDCAIIPKGEHLSLLSGGFTHFR